MSASWIVPVLLLLALLAVQRLHAVSVVYQQPDDESELEHEVTAQEALAKAKNLKLYPGPIPGCKPCTKDEMAYCEDGSVLEDHCCCDAGYNEVFGFVQHTCRVGPEACRVRAGDCAEYSRLRECCCHPYLASTWKYLAGSAATTRASHFLLGYCTLFLLLYVAR